MIKLLKKIFVGDEPTKKPTSVHEYFGLIQYDKDSKTWDTLESNVYHGGIRGDISGPSNESTEEIKNRLQDINKYWDICEDDLRYIAESYDSFPKGRQIKELFKLAALSLYNDYWEVCFETYPEFKWLYVGMQFEGCTLVSNTIDT
jgi:hypothetical protein